MIDITNMKIEHIKILYETLTSSHKTILEELSADSKDSDSAFLDEALGNKEQLIREKMWLKKIWRKIFPKK